MRLLLLLSCSHTQQLGVASESWLSLWATVGVYLCHALLVVTQVVICVCNIWFVICETLLSVLSVIKED